MHSERLPAAIADRPEKPRAARYPIALILFSCIFLQRFGIHLGGLRFPVVALIVSILLVFLFFMRRAVLHEPAVVLFCLFSSAALLSAIVSFTEPAHNTGATLSSLAYVLCLYSLLALRLVEPPPLEDTLSIFSNMVLFVALAGCAQFGLQFAKLGLFSFSPFLPDAILLEPDYNVVVPLGFGSEVMKANGFFLLEPSIFSQYVSMAVLIEVLYFKRIVRLAVLLTALAVSFSGTGLLVLGCGACALLLFERRAVSSAVLPMLVSAVLAIVVVGLLAPQYAELFVGRSGELSSTETSGFLRFISPYRAVRDVAGEPRILFGFGPGAAERFHLTYNYGVNALTKILLDYGILGFLSYVALIIVSYVRRAAPTLSVAGLFWFVAGGGYHLTPAIVFTLAALFTWGTGTTSSERRMTTLASRSAP